MNHRCLYAINYILHQQLKNTRQQYNIFQSQSSFSTQMTPPPEKAAVFIDTDAGFDDVLAISSLLNANNPKICVPFISTVGGIQECTHRACRFLNKIYPSTKVVAGLSSFQQDAKDGIPNWLLEYRTKLDEIVPPLEIIQSTTFNKNEDVTLELHTSLQNTLQQYPDQSVDLLCLGPLTNVASWINDEATLSILDCKLKNIYIMGGHTPDTSYNNNNNTTDEAEFNFAQDPKAVHTVLTNPILRKRINLVTAQACTKNTIDAKEWNDIVNKSQKDGQGILSKVFKVEPCQNIFKYDPVAAFVLANSLNSNNNLISMKSMEVIINQETGLLRAASSTNDDSDCVSIKIVDEVKIDSEYTAFINDGIVNDPPI